MVFVTPSHPVEPYVSSYSGIDHSLPHDPWEPCTCPCVARLFVYFQVPHRFSFNLPWPLIAQSQVFWLTDCLFSWLVVTCILFIFIWLIHTNSTLYCSLLLHVYSVKIFESNICFALMIFREKYLSYSRQIWLNHVIWP